MRWPWSKREALRTGAPIRGRISRISKVRGGEISIVLRFGLEEDEAQRLMQGELLEVYHTTEDRASETKCGAP